MLKMTENRQPRHKQTRQHRPTSFTSTLLTQLRSCTAPSYGLLRLLPRCSQQWCSQAPQWQNLQNLTSTPCKHRCLNISTHIIKVFRGQSALGRIWQKLHSYVFSYQIGSLVLTLLPSSHYFWTPRYRFLCRNRLIGALQHWLSS